MNKRNNLGFTLVEIISIIAIIGVIAVIVLPQISGSSKKKQKQYDNMVTTIENAAKSYYSINPNVCYVTLDMLIDEDYLSSGLTNPITETNFTGCVKFGLDENLMADYEYESNNSVCDAISESATSSLTINPNGGSYDGKSTPIVINSICTRNQLYLKEPTHPVESFTGWSVSGRGSSVKDNLFTMGVENATVTARWIIYTLTVDPNGGIYNGTTQETTYSLVPEAQQEVIFPKRAGYAFAGWTMNDTDSTMNRTTFTMGSANTTLTANWVLLTDMFTYMVDNGQGEMVAGVADTDYKIIDDGDGNWRVKFLTSGNFTPLIDIYIDLFLVGGGGGGGGLYGYAGGGGGGGGRTTTITDIFLPANPIVPHPIVIGAGGAGGTSGKKGDSSTAFGHHAEGGNGGAQGGTFAGGAGGSGGGAGGYNGCPTTPGNGGSYGNAGGGTRGGSGGKGQAGSDATKNTCEFGEGTLSGCDGGNNFAYGAGGGGGRGCSGTCTQSDGSLCYPWNGASGKGGGKANSGGGGAGAGLNGYTGIVIIRNKR